MIIRILVSVFFVLHGVVHLLYLGQSTRLFELQPGMVWPDGAWAFSRLLGDDATRTLANVLLVVAAIGFATGGVALLARQGWWRPVIVGSAVFSAILYLLLWDGVTEALANKGGVGILINLVILLVVLVFQWPRLDS